MTNDNNICRPGRLFIVLWTFAVFLELISLQIRLAIFGGTGWLTYIKFTTIGSRLGFISILTILCAALCGLWVLIFTFIGKKAKCAPEIIQRRCATCWVVLLAVDLFFRHKIGELLGNAFSFFEFASGVGGVWRMLVQAFQWYGDIIIMSVLGVTAFSVATWAFFRWFFKPRTKISRLDRIPSRIINVFILVSFVAGLVLMSVCAPKFPDIQKILASETLFGAAFNVIVNVGSDFDGDGYGAFDLPPDSEPFNSKLHPHALDIPDDGTDQDLLAGDLNRSDIPKSIRERVEHQGIPNRQSFSDRRNVIIVLMESVRYDMLDAKIDDTPVMPELQKFIKDGAVRIDGAFASRGFTQNSVTQTFWGSFFDPGHSLVDDFKSLGYHTAVFNGEMLSDEKFDESCGWNRAGDTIVDPGTIEENVDHHQSVPANMLMNKVESFLDQYDTSTPLFMYLFYQDPHFPYQQDNPSVFIDREIKRSEISAKTRPRLWRTYANQVYHLDMAAGRLIQALKNKKMLDNSLVIFISDHGESLFDDGYLLGHGIAIQDLMTHAVMLIWGAHHDIPAMFSHPDIRRFIWDDFASIPKETSIVPVDAPVLQFIGATTVPSAISHRFADGSRVTYEFASHTAWRETSNASYPGQRQRLRLPDHGNTPIDQQVDITKDLVPDTRYWSPIPNALQNPQVQTLIREWEYMQWFHQHN
ncbi:MAG: sulfatase-like hydrolase/transferase [Proteobacteria bacterium]|nr:sulfatase-like hydrolase/transferase [Pseudomonadota bacterium]